MNKRINFTHPNHQLYKPEEVLGLVNDGCENAISVEQFLEENNRPYLFWRMYDHRTETGDRGQLRTTAELGSWFLYYKRMYQLSQFGLKVDVNLDNFAKVIKHNDERDANRYIVKQNGKYMVGRDFFVNDFRRASVFPWDTAVVEAAKLKGAREIEIEKERKKW